MDDRCLRGGRRDLEVSPRFDVASELNDPSIAFDRGRPLELDRPIGRAVRFVPAPTKLSLPEGY